MTGCESVSGDDDAPVYALTPDGVQGVPMIDVGEGFEPLAICPGRCHLLVRFPEVGVLWAVVSEDARERWARQGLPVREP